MDISVRPAEQQNKTESAIKKQSICPMVNALFTSRFRKRKGEQGYEKS